MKLTRDILSTFSTAFCEPLEPRQLLAFGQLDQGFGNVGRALAEFSADADAPLLQDVEVAGDGAILAGGSGGLVQWTADGQADADFGAGGNLALDGSTYRDHEIGPDGSVYVLASNAGGSVVKRYTDAGQVDLSFGTDGALTVSTSPLFTPAAVAVQDDGKVVVVGTARTDAGKGAVARLYRFGPDGAADMGFGNLASIEVQLGVPTEQAPIERDTVAGVTVLPGGRIVVAGSSLVYRPEVFIDEANIYEPAFYGDSVFATARLTPEGQPDPTYGEHGVSRAVYATGFQPEPATAFAQRTLDDAIALAAYTDRLVYAQFNASGFVAFNRSAEVTSGFGRPLDLAAKGDGRFAVLGLPEAYTDHGLQVAYVSPDGGLGQVIQSDDTFQGTVDLLESGPAAIAVAEDGDLLIGGRPGDGTAAYEVVKIDDGEVDETRTDQFADARGNDLVRDSAGGVHLTFFDATSAVLKYAYRAPNGLWSGPVTVDGEPESGHYISIAVDAGNRPGIAYFDGLHGDLKYAYSPTDGVWTTQLVEGVGNVGLYPSLQFDSSARPTIAYYRKTGGELKIAAQVAEGQWAQEVIDAENDVGRSAALVAQPLSGRWSIAYTDTTTGAVKFAWRTPRKVWQIETAATTRGGADFLSLAYNPSTEPAGVYLHAAISYYDAYNADLAITQSSGDGVLVWQSRLLSAKNNVGLYTHLTFDAFFGPTVYYYNRTSDRITRLTDHFHDGVTADILAEGAGRYLSVFSDGNTVDLAFFDEDEAVLKVRSMPLRV